MADHTVTGLRAAIKALSDVVTPAVDPANPLAGEQLRMVCSYLSLVIDRVPLRSQRIDFELQCAKRLTQSLRPLAKGCDTEADAALQAALDAADSIERNAPAEADVLRITAMLNAAAASVVRAAGGADADTARKVERCVVTHSKDWLDLQRAWFAPLGSDSGAAELPSVEAALSVAP